MENQLPVALFVKLGYWDALRLNVELTTHIFRKILYVWGAFFALWLALSALSIFHLQPEQEWVDAIRNDTALKWAFAAPLLILYGAPLLAARRIVRDGRIKRGTHYQFWENQIHIETPVSKTDLSWTAIRRVSEIHSAFVVFTGRNSAFALPKKFFEKPQDVAALRALFRAHVEETKLRRD